MCRVHMVTRTKHAHARTHTHTRAHTRMDIHIQAHVAQLHHSIHAQVAKLTHLIPHTPHRARFGQVVQSGGCPLVPATESSA